MLRRFLTLILFVAVAGAVAAYIVTAPDSVEPARFTGLEGDATAGETVYWAAGCASCHAAEDDEARTLLSGGHRLQSDFGTFVTPNISPDPTHGIGAWTLTDFANSILKGTSPAGSHYYPAYPYASYAAMTDKDVADLWAFLLTLPISDKPSAPHELGFPFNIRLSLGGWKMLYLHSSPQTPEDRGTYLVEVLGHCAECHTPRDALGGLDRSRWMAGAPNPSGEGNIPPLTPDKLTWSETDIAYYLETGFTPDFDSAGGSMVSVIKGTAKLSAEDRTAIAAYIKALP